MRKIRVFFIFNAFLLSACQFNSKVKPVELNQHLSQRLCDLSIELHNRALVKQDSIQAYLRWHTRQILKQEAFDYARNHHYDTTYCILLDYSIHSGLNRMFVYHHQKPEPVLAHLACHGLGEIRDTNVWYEEPLFSNVPESYCSCIGRFVIGKRGPSGWGVYINYRLHGLDTSNSNAYDRLIVLHSLYGIPDEEYYPYAISQSAGCPAVSNEAFHRMDSLLIDRQNQVLMRTYWLEF